MSNSNPGRREFLQSAAATASTLAFAGATSFHHDGSDTLKVGLIGCGGRGTGAAEQALRADSGTKLWAMGDAFHDRLTNSWNQLRGRSAIREQVEVPEARRFVGFNAYQEVIGCGVDVVLLCTPPHFRPMHLRACVDAGMHVFCEKPAAVDAPGCRSVLASCQEARRRSLSIVSGLCYRYDQPIRDVIHRVHDGAIGQIVAMQTTYNTGGVWMHERQPSWSDMEWQLRNWIYFNWLSGDHLNEQGVHDLDTMCWAMGDVYPVKAVASGGRQVRTGPQFGNIFDHFAVVYEFANGVKCHSSCRQQVGCANDVSDYLVGTNGIADVLRQRIFNHQKAQTWRFQGRADNPYQVEHDELFASIRSGKPINNGEYMAKSTLMGIMGRMAAYTGREITWQQALNSAEDLTPARYAWGDMPVAPVARPGITQFV